MNLSFLTNFTKTWKIRIQVPVLSTKVANHDFSETEKSCVLERKVIIFAPKVMTSLSKMLHQKTSYISEVITYYWKRHTLNRQKAWFVSQISWFTVRTGCKRFEGKLNRHRLLREKSCFTFRTGCKKVWHSWFFFQISRFTFRIKRGTTIFDAFYANFRRKPSSVWFKFWCATISEFWRCTMRQNANFRSLSNSGLLQQIQMA